MATANWQQMNNHARAEHSSQVRKRVLPCNDINSSLQTNIVDRMAQPKLTRLELQIMEALWTLGALSVREIQEAFPEKNRPAYTTVQTTVYRLEEKGALRREEDQQRSHLRSSRVARGCRDRLIDDLLSLFGGRTQPVMAHLVESGKFTLDDVQETEKLLRKLAKKEKLQMSPVH